MKIRASSFTSSPFLRSPLRFSPNERSQTAPTCQRWLKDVRKTSYLFQVYLRRHDLTIYSSNLCYQGCVSFLGESRENVTQRDGVACMTCYSLGSIEFIRLTKYIRALRVYDNIRIEICLYCVTHEATTDGRRIEPRREDTRARKGIYAFNL